MVGLRYKYKDYTRTALIENVLFCIDFWKYYTAAVLDDLDDTSQGGTV